MDIKQAIISLQRKLGILVCNYIQEELEVFTRSIPADAGLLADKEEQYISHKDWIAQGKPTNKELSESAVKDRVLHPDVPMPEIKEVDQPKLFETKKGRGKDTYPRKLIPKGVVKDTLRHAKNSGYRDMLQPERVAFDKQVKKHLLEHRNIHVSLNAVYNMLKGKTNNKIYKEVFDA